jgi:hypothetical protein
VNNRAQKLLEQYEAYCGVLGVKAVLHTRQQHTGEAHVEFLDDGYHYVVTERGTELVRRITADEDEMLYWLLSDVVFDLASGYELQNRVKGQSFRRLLFAKELELMRRLNPSWAERKSGEIEAVLAKNPYDDVVEG